MRQVTKMRPRRIKPEQRLDFRLTRRERDLIIERTFIDAELEKPLQAAQALGSRLVVHLPLQKLLNYIRASGSEPSWAEKLPLFVAEVSESSPPKNCAVTSQRPRVSARQPTSRPMNSI